MNQSTKLLFAIATLALAAQATAQVTVYQAENFVGRSYTPRTQVVDFSRAGFNDRVSSVVIGGEQRWQACDDVRLAGQCKVLRPGRYASLQAMGLQGRVSSMRPLPADERVADAAYAAAAPSRDFGRRRNEAIDEAVVTSARAVVGTPGQRCWMEREQVAQRPAAQGGVLDNANVPGALIGGLIGGILGHQVGGGTGKTIATVGGAAGGAYLGSQYGHNAAAPPTVGQDVRRCDNNPVEAKAAYWDVTYDYRGTEHRVQMTNQPGRTINVNRNGEPRT